MEAVQVSGSAARDRTVGRPASRTGPTARSNVSVVRGAPRGSAAASRRPDASLDRRSVDQQAPAAVRVRPAEAMMLTLFSYPELYGLADNNPYGLKVYAFLRLCRLEFRHEHIFDAKAAPRGQLPYVEDDGETVGDSDEIVDHLVAKYRPPIDLDLTPAQRTLDHLLRRTLDDLYWVMSYSRWHDPRYWPTFRDEILGTHPGVTAEELEAARAYNDKRYHYQGIGRYEPEGVYLAIHQFG